MANVVLAVPPVGPPQAARLTGMSLTWTGWDGSVWHLTDFDSPVQIADEGIVGLTFAPAEIFTTSSPSVAGSRFRAFRTQERPVRLPLDVFAPGSALAWFELEKAFWATMRRGRTGVLSLTQQPSGQTRTLVCRFVTDGQKSYSLDPASLGWARYEVDLVAHDPYWCGETVRRSFEAATPEDFIPEGDGPPFTISESSTLSSASISNPGDTDAWPVWTVTATDSGITAVSVSVAGAELASAEALADGDVMVIDTDPRRQSVTINGTRVRGVLTSHQFAPIPHGGATVPLDVSVTGTGSVKIEIVPKWERAW